jgi:TonB family protein
MYRILLSLALLAAAAPTLTAQIGQAAEDTTVYRWPERMPLFAGCDPADAEADNCSLRQLTLFLYGQMRYPADALQARTPGVVTLTLVVGRQGRVKEARVKSGSGTPSLDQEALRLARAMPAWTPGRQGDKPVAVEMDLPVNFDPRLFIKE